MRKRHTVSPMLGALIALMLALVACSPTQGGAPSKPADAKPAATLPPSGQAAPAGGKPAGQPTAAPAKPAEAAKPAESKPAAPFRAVIGHAAEESTFDPNITNTVSWISVLLHTYDSLVTRDASGKIVPSLAESWRSVDPTTWEMTLRKGVKFHDGSDFSAEDVKFTLDRVLNPETKSAQAGWLATLKETQVVDPSTVRFITKAPDPFLIDNLQLIPISSSKFIREKGAALANSENGTGPYVLAEWVKGDRLVMRAAEGHWRGAPKVTEVVYRVIPESSALVAALQTGEIDIAINVPPDNAKVLGNASGFSIESVPSQRSVFIVFDNTVKPLDDVKVRQALNYGVDRKELVDGVLLGYAEAIPTLVGPMYFGLDESLKPYPYDPDKAKQLLAEAGYSNGLELQVFAPSGRYVKDKEVIEAIAGQLTKVGVKLNLRIQEWGTFINQYRDKKVSPAYLIGYGLPIWDATQPFRSYLVPASIGAYYKSPELEKMTMDALTTIDNDQRKQILQQIDRRVYEEAGFLFLYVQKDIYGVSNRLSWKPRSDERVWMYDAAPK